jgi:hypothetical protein
MPGKIRVLGIMLAVLIRSIISPAFYPAFMPGRERITGDIPPACPMAITDLAPNNAAAGGGRLALANEDCSWFAHHTWLGFGDHAWGSNR